MKLFRLGLGALIAMAAAIAAQAQTLSITGITASPSSAKPGDSVTYSIAVSNSSTAAGVSASNAANFTILHTNTVTGYSFTITGSGQPLADIAAATTSGGVVTPATGTFTLTATVPTQTTEAGPYRATVTGADDGVGAAMTFSSSFSASTTILTVTGTPDFQISSLTYTANTNYRGGDVLPMTLTYRNNSASSGGTTNVPWVPSTGTTYFRIHVVLSSNPTYGDADDFQLTFFDRTTKLDANNTDVTFSWSQLLPGNFSGSYYVLAKIDSLNQVAETVESDLTLNGNNIWQDIAATRIALQPTTFPTIYLASTTGTSGTSPSGSGYSDNPSLTADGRYTAFASDATNLVTGDTNAVRDIFIFDSQNSLVRRLSLSQQGAQANANSNNPGLSGNGRYVAFSSDATNLIIGDVNGFTDIFVVDTLTGAISLQSVTAAGVQANGSSFRPAMSHTGRYLVFESSATNLVSPATTAGVTHIFLRNRDVSNSGTFDTPGNTSTVLIDTSAAAGNANASQAAISADGQFVTFASRATNLAAAATTAGRQHIYVRDVTGATTTIVSVGTGGAEANADSRNPSINRNTGVTTGISSDGRFVAFASDATNLVAGDTNAVSDVFVFDRTASTTARVSVSSAGAEAVDPTVNTTFGSKLGSLNPSINATGRYVTFASLANNLAPGDNVGRYNAAGSGNAALNIYVVDRDVSASGTYGTAGNISTTNVSVNRFGYQAYYILNTQSTAAADIFPVISADGRWVAFPFDAEGAQGLIHNATNMLSSDANGARDVVLFDRRTNSLPTANTPPTVNITNPGNNTAVLVNTPISVTASATTSTGVVATVQFFVNGTSIGTSAAFPYSATWTPTAVGSYTLSALVTDSFGNLGVSPNIAVTVNAAPSVGITSPTTTSTVTAGSAQTVTASASASNPGATIASVQFFVNGTSLGTVTTAPYSVAWTPAAAGSYTLTARATDSVGTQTTSPAVTITVATGGGGGGGGTTPPTVSVVTPASGSTLSVNTPQTVIASATATGGTVTSVEFFANGTSIGVASSFPYRITWTPNTPGSYAITATARDQNGAQATSTANSVTVTAGTAPSITLVSPAPGATIAVGTAQTLVANATAGSGIVTGVQFFANGLLLGSDTTFPYNLAWIPTGVGPVTLTAVATDSVGNQTTSTAVGVTVASVSPSAPTVAITSPAAGASLPIGTATIIAATAADPDGTITSVQFFANGIAVAAADTTFPFNTPFTPTSAGSYVLTAQAIDNGGNITTSAAITVNVAGNAAPSVAVTSPAAGAAVGVNAPQTLTANASSPGGVITSVQFFVNGVAVGAADTTFPYSAEWTPLAVGTYSVGARATDNVGNITDSAPIVITAAGSAPATVSITNPINGSSFTVGTVLSLTASSADTDGTITSVQFFVNGVPVSAADTSAPYTSAWTPTSVGVYTLTARSIDNTGNVTTSAPVIVTIGANAAPVISLTSPVGGLSYSLGSQVLVAAAASDADGTVANVQFFANGLLIGTSTTSPFLVSWRPTAAGNYTLTATATDNAGNATTTAPVAVTVTSVGAPGVAITNPASGSSFVAGNAIPLVANTTGGNGPIAQVQFFINGAPLGAPDSTSPYTASWTPGASGTYSVIAVATDSAGVSSNSPSVDVVITGNVAPTSVITSPSSGSTVTSGTAVNLTASATDVDGTVASVRFLANGNVVATASAAPFIGTWTPSAIGSYSIVAQAQDNSGNITNSAPIVLNVSSNQAPTAVLTSPANGSAVRVNTNVTVNATASDPDGTITSVQFFANGVAIGAADTIAPYSASFTPPAEGVYRITAVALDNSGASTTSAVVSLAVVSAGVSDTVYTGTYAGLSEAGRFAAVVVRGKTAAFIGYTTSGGNRTYSFPSLAVDGAGGFAAFDSVGRSLVSGTANETGVTGTIDNGRLTFIGVVSFASNSLTSLAGYYNGSLTGRNTSSIAAIVAGDGSIMVLVEDGTFRDAGSGNVNTTGGFTVTTPAGNRITGTIDLASGFMTGTLVGGPGGPFTAAIASGVSFSDGFLRNLSTRGQVGTGANILIAGFVVGGNSPKQVLIRAIGPSLAGFGITNALVDTQLELFNGNTLIASNDNWGGASALSTPSNQAGAFPLSPSSLDSVIYTSLPPGSYTAQVSGVGGRTGVALVELYDTDNLQPFAAQKVTNVATRGVVGTGPAQLIAGFVVSGNTSKKVLIRGVGPTLGGAPFNVAGVLADPILKLVRTDGGATIVRENDNWEMGNDASLINDAAVKVGAFPLASGARDAAMLINLPPGTYSAQVTGPGTTTGVALVEVYEVP